MPYLNHNKFIATLWSLFFFIGIASSQSRIDTFDVRFALKTTDCAAKKVTFQMQLRAHNLADTFLMGNGNFRFDYDPRAIANPVITQQPNYSIFAKQPINFNYTPQNLNGSSAGSTIGTVSLQVIYSGSAGGAQKVDTAWTTVSCLQFDIINSDSCFNLIWHDGSRFPITGMSKVTLKDFGEYTTSDSLSGNFYNYLNCSKSKCSSILAKNDKYVTPFNTPKKGNVASNDTSSDIKTVNVTPVQTPKNGSVSLQANGDFTYNPAINFAGVDSFVYTICNAQNVCMNATAFISILPSGSKGITVDTTTHKVPQDTTMQLCSNVQTDITSPKLGFVPCGDLHGTYTGTLNSQNQLCLMYTPNKGYIGADSVCVTICDSATNFCDTTKIPIIVTPKQIPAKPTTIVTTVVTKQDSTVTKCFTIQDTLSQPNFITSLCGVKNGSAQIISTDNTNKQVCVSYTPTAGYFGTDTICLIVCNVGGCDTAKIPVNVTQKPILLPAKPKVNVVPISTNQGVAVSKCFTITDTLSNPTYTTSLCVVKNGTVQPSINNKNLCVVYTPTTTFSGLDTICIIVCNAGGCDTARIPVTVFPKQVPPAKPKVVVSPLTVIQDSVISACFSIYDTLSNPVYTSSLCGTKHGLNEIKILDNLSQIICLRYTPSTGFVGSDTICIILCNAGGCDTARIPVQVTPKPVLPAKPKVNVSPIITQQGSGVSKCFTITDTLTNPTYTSSVCGVKNGNVLPSINNKSLCVIYTPNSAFSGSDTICIIVCNAGGCDTARIPVTVVAKQVPPAKPKVNVQTITTTQDSTITKCFSITDTLTNPAYTKSLCGVNHGNVLTTISNKNICVTYVPNAGYFGSDTICVIVCNAGGCDTARIPVTVIQKIVVQPSKPKLNVSILSTVTDSTVLKCFVVTDTTKNATFTATSCGVNHGNVSFNIVGNLVCASYIPNKNYAGLDTICVIVCNNTGGCDTARIPVIVSPKTVNNPPTVDVTPIITLINSEKVVCFTITDADVSDLHSGQICSTQHGSTTVQVANKQACITYKPTLNYVGADTICLTICDNHNACVTVKIPVTVNNTINRCTDNVAPTIVFTNPLYANVKSGDTIVANCTNPPIFGLTSVKVTDDTDKNPKYSFRDINRTLGNCQRDGYKILMECEYTATDSCGNTKHLLFFVKIVDTTPPTLANIPPDVTVNNIAPTAPVVTATDDCGTATVTVSETSQPYNCGTIIKRTWVATDECGNTTSKTQKITVNKGLSVVIGNITGETCAKNDGSAQLSPANVSYNWSNGSTGNLLANLKAGTYQVSATAAEGCTATVQVVIPDNCQCTPPTATLATTSETCGNKNGTATISISNTNNYTITWSNGSTNSAKITNLAAGNYFVTVANSTDANCKKVFSFTVGADSSNCCKKYITNATIYVTASSCDVAASACTEIPFAKISDYTVTDNGATYTGSFTNCSGNTALNLNVGNHSLAFKNKTQNNCIDSLWVKVACPTNTGGGRITRTVTVNNSDTWCLSNIPLLHPVTVMNECPSASGSAAIVNIDQQTGCVTFKGLKSGTDSVCLKFTSTTGDVYRFTLIIAVSAQRCANLIAPDTTIVNGTCNADGKVAVCIPVSLSALQGYTITLDNNLYNQALTTCLDSSTQFLIPTGVHKLFFASSAGCNDSLTVGTACVRTQTIITELRTGGKDTLCISSNELIGRKYYLQNICAAQSGKKVDFNLQGGTTCIERFAKTIGSEKACYLLCDEYGICDTTYMIVNVTELKAKTPAPKAVADEVKVLKNTTATHNILLNDTFGSLLPAVRLLKYPVNGTLTLGVTGQITYKPAKNYCGSDAATYELCTSTGCDTATIAFKVGCDELVIYSAFSPNNDGRNDFFTIEGIEKLTNNTVSVFNRWGSEVFVAKNYKNDWGGTWNGTNLPDGTYFYVFTDGDGHTLTGYVQIQR